MTQPRTTHNLVRTIVLAALMALPSLATQAADDFYKGKQIHLIIPTPAGGSYDGFARIVARHMPNYIPGKPTMVPENKPGASGLLAANYIYSTAPKDGLTIGAGYAGLPTSQLLSPEGVQYDINKFSWIGNITKEPYVGLVWHKAEVQTLEGALTKPMVLGGSAVGAAGTDFPIIAKALFGYNFKIVTGYPNSPEMKLAMEKGDLDAQFATGWGALNISEPTWIKEGKVRVFVQHGFTKHPTIPDAPLLIDQAKKPEDRQLLELLLVRQETSKPYFAPPGVPAERIDILRRAFDATMKDPQFLAEVRKANLEVDQPMTGEELAAMTFRLSQTPTWIPKKIQEILTAFKESK